MNVASGRIMQLGRPRIGDPWSVYTWLLPGQMGDV